MKAYQEEALNFVYASLIRVQRLIQPQMVLPRCGAVDHRIPLSGTARACRIARVLAYLSDHQCVQATQMVQAIGNSPSEKTPTVWKFILCHAFNTYSPTQSHSLVDRLACCVT